MSGYDYVLPQDRKQPQQCDMPLLQNDHYLITASRTIIFSMPKYPKYDGFSSQQKFFFKRRYLKQQYLAKLVWFQEDDMPADPATRVYFYTFDYYARFEVEGYEKEPEIFHASMILLENLCRDELSSPATFPVFVAAEMQAELYKQTEQYCKHTGLGKKLQASSTELGLPLRPPQPVQTAEPSGGPISVRGPCKHLRRKLLNIQHANMATSVATFARTETYNAMRAWGIRRRMCTEYEGGVGMEVHDRCEEQGWEGVVLENETDN